MSWIIPYLLLIIIPMLIGFWAQWRVRSTFQNALQVPAASGMTGAEVAQAILDAHNIKNVGIERVEGTLSDHYDPKEKMLRLSSDIYDGRSVASLGIAAHEVGHAIQDATKYAPLVIRNGIVPMAMVGNFGLILCAIGAMIGAAAMGGAGKWVLIVGIALFSIVVIFQLINLPVEFDASRRARDLLYSTNMVAKGGESQAMDKVLSAAAMTYVAGTVASIGTLLYYVLMLAGSNNNRE
jgi:Zn-dependent membrane protease YugP